MCGNLMTSQLKRRMSLSQRDKADKNIGLPNGSSSRRDQFMNYSHLGKIPGGGPKRCTVQGCSPVILSSIALVLISHRRARCSIQRLSQREQRSYRQALGANSCKCKRFGILVLAGTWGCQVISKP